MRFRMIGLWVLLVACAGPEGRAQNTGTCDDGTCDANEDNCTCPQDCPGDCPTGLPDLLYDPDAMNPTVISATFAAADCAVQEGCAKAGDRKLLRFATEVRNVGTADLVFGDPETNPLFVYNTCFDHYEFREFGEWRLVDGEGPVLTGSKAYFCLSDDFRHDPSGSLFPSYSCRNQGLSVGWTDVYQAGLACQWIDVTDIAPGEYTLEVEVNFERLLAESDYSNNVTSVSVVIPEGDVPAPITACGVGLFPAMFVGVLTCYLLRGRIPHARTYATVKSPRSTRSRARRGG